MKCLIEDGGLYTPCALLDEELTFAEIHLLSLIFDNGRKEIDDSNRVLAKVCATSQKTISNIISKLTKEGYITVRYEYYPETKCIKRRILRVTKQLQEKIYNYKEVV